jgi:hypothetical protein
MQNSHVISEPYIFEREREHRLSMRDSILFEKLGGTEPLREREREGEENGREEAGSLRTGGKKKTKEREWVVGDKEIKKLISIKQSERWVSWEKEMMRISHILIIFYYYFF